VRTLNAALVVASIALAPIVYAAEVGDPQRGHVYAEKFCAKCHAVEAGDVFSPTMIAPTFSAVADTPGMNERELIVWFRSSDHETMPNLMPTPGDLDDVVAYIMSLHAQK
jgi:mono/diheme cytochrome c family protein